MLGIDPTVECYHRVIFKKKNNEQYYKKDCNEVVQVKLYLRKLHINCNCAAIMKCVSGILILLLAPPAHMQMNMHHLSSCPKINKQEWNCIYSQHAYLPLAPVCMQPKFVWKSFSMTSNNSRWIMAFCPTLWHHWTEKHVFFWINQQSTERVVGVRMSTNIYCNVCGIECVLYKYTQSQKLLWHVICFTYKIF